MIMRAFTLLIMASWQVAGADVPAPLAARMDHQLMLEVIRKTARKMSAPGLDLAASIPLTGPERALLGEALDGGRA